MKIEIKDGECMFVASGCEVFTLVHGLFALHEQHESLEDNVHNTVHDLLDTFLQATPKINALIVAEVEELENMMGRQAISKPTKEAQENFEKWLRAAEENKGEQ